MIVKKRNHRVFFSSEDICISLLTKFSIHSAYGERVCSKSDDFFKKNPIEFQADIQTSLCLFLTLNFGKRE